MEERKIILQNFYKTIQSTKNCINIIQGFTKTQTFNSKEFCNIIEEAISLKMEITFCLMRYNLICQQNPNFCQEREKIEFIKLEVCSQLDKNLNQTFEHLLKHSFFQMIDQDFKALLRIHKKFSSDNIFPQNLDKILLSTLTQEEIEGMIENFELTLSTSGNFQEKKKLDFIELISLINEKLIKFGNEFSEIHFSFQNKIRKFMEQILDNDDIKFQLGSVPGKLFKEKNVRFKFFVIF